MKLVNIRVYTAFDKALMLWALCCIDHYKDQKGKLSAKSMTDEFGEEVQLYFDTAIELLAPYGLIDIERLRLTSQGQLVANNWQSVSARLFDPMSFSQL